MLSFETVSRDSQACAFFLFTYAIFRSLVLCDDLRYLDYFSSMSSAFSMNLRDNDCQYCCASYHVGRFNQSVSSSILELSARKGVFTIVLLW